MPDLERDQSTDYARTNEVQQISRILGATPEPESNTDQTDEQVGDPGEETRQHAPDDQSQPHDGEQPPAAAETADDLEEGDEPELEDNAAEPVKLKELAETLELDTRELYDLEVQVGPDQFVTLGQLKDGFKEVRDLEQTRSDFEETRTRQENELMVAKRQIEQLVALGVQTNMLTPEVIDHVEKLHVANVDRERKAMLSAVPEWSNDDTRRADLSEISDLLMQYGFSQVEIDGVIDHRLLKFARDMAKRENQIKRATKEQQQAGGKPQTKIANGRKAPRKSKLRERIEAAKTKPGRENLGLIDELIQGAK